MKMNTNYKRIRSIHKCIERLKYELFDTKEEEEFYIKKIIDSQEEFGYVFLIQLSRRNNDEDLKNKLIDPIFNHKNKFIRSYCIMFYDIFNDDQKKEIINDISNDFDLTKQLLSNAKIEVNIRIDFARTSIPYVRYFTYIKDDNCKYIKYVMECLYKNLDKYETLKIIFSSNLVLSKFLYYYPNFIKEIKISKIDIPLATSILETIDTFKDENLLYMKNILSSKNILSQFLLSDKIENRYSLVYYTGDFFKLLMNDNLFYNIYNIILSTKKMLNTKTLEILFKILPMNRSYKLCEAIYKNNNINTIMICHIWEYNIEYNNVIQCIPNEYINQSIYEQFKIFNKLSLN